MPYEESLTDEYSVETRSRIIDLDRSLGGRGIDLDELFKLNHYELACLLWRLEGSALWLLSGKESTNAE